MLGHSISVVIQGQAGAQVDVGGVAEVDSAKSAHQRLNLRHRHRNIPADQFATGGNWGPVIGG